MQRKTLVIHCFVADPVTGESYSRDPRYVAQKAEAYMKSTGIADTAYFGPEPEFFIFDDVRFDYHAELRVPHGRLGRGHLEHRPRRAARNLGYKPRTKQGYFPVPPMDHYQDLRSEMAVDLARRRHRGRAAPPRGRHRRPGRDRHEVQHAAARWPTS